MSPTSTFVVGHSYTFQTCPRTASRILWLGFYLVWKASAVSGSVGESDNLTSLSAARLWPALLTPSGGRWRVLTLAWPPTEGWVASRGTRSSVTIGTCSLSLSPSFPPSRSLFCSLLLFLSPWRTYWRVGSALPEMYFKVYLETHIFLWTIPILKCRLLTHFPQTLCRWEKNPNLRATFGINETGGKGEF